MKKDNKLSCRLSEEEEHIFYSLLLKSNLNKTDFIKQKILKEENITEKDLKNKIEKLTLLTQELLINQHIIFKLTEGIVLETIKKDDHKDYESIVKKFIEEVRKEAVKKVMANEK